MSFSFVKLTNFTKYSCQVQYFSSQDVIERCQKYCAQNYKSIPVAIVKASGIHAWDVEGKQYIDFAAGNGTQNIGHSHPQIIETATKQISNLSNASRSFYSDKLGELAEYITSLFGYDKFLPMSTGTEAADSAIKVARRWGYYAKGIKRYDAHIVLPEHSFWGRSIAAVSTSSDPTHSEGFGPFLPGFITIRYDNLKALEQVIKGANVCAFLMEPMHVETVPKPGYLKGIRNLCSTHNVLWIANEIHTGLGRTGKRLCCDYEQVKPDILVLGKSLGGGVYPVSGILANKVVMNVLNPGSHGSTFGGNDLGSAIALQTLKILDKEKLAENAQTMGELFRAGMLQLPKEIVASIQGKGLLNGVAIDTEFIDPWKFCLQLKKNGVLAILTKENMIRFTPPLSITRDEMLKSIDIIVNSAKELLAK